MFTLTQTHWQVAHRDTHRQHGLLWVLMLGLFQCYFHLWIILIETLQNGCPGSWDLRPLDVPSINSWSLKVHKTVKVWRYTRLSLSCEIFAVTLFCQPIIHMVLTHSLFQCSALHAHVYRNHILPWLNALLYMNMDLSLSRSSQYSFPTVPVILPANMSHLQVLPNSGVIWA